MPGTQDACLGGCGAGGKSSWDPVCAACAKLLPPPLRHGLVDAVALVENHPEQGEQVIETVAEVWEFFVLEPNS